MQPDFSLLQPSLAHLSSGDRGDIRHAFDFAVSAHTPQKREDGTPYVLHVIEVAKTVAEWGADRDTIVAALLHDVLEDTPVTKEEITERFGRHVGLLVEGITKFTQADLSPDLPLDRKIETLRKLFDVMRLDMRSIIIKLADRLHNVQTINALPTEDRRKRFALETLTVYYKIAFHLGMREVRRIFAEFCVPHAFPEGAEELRERDRFCIDGEKLCRMVAKDLTSRDESHRIQSVTLQPRNLLVCHQRKADRGGQAGKEDAFSIVVMVKTEEDCYRLLKSIHTLYRPVSGHFRDFIAAPSDAGYQSLHTHVTLRDGTVLECRIRTHAMWEQAEKGITVALFGSQNPPPSFAWLQRSASLDLKTRDSSSAFWEALESDVLREANSVTVDRKRMSLPKGATALDAAYALYDEKAGDTIAMTVNGRPVPLSETLKEDDDVHVEMGKQQVTFDWLQMVSTRHARMLIVDVLKRSDKSEKVALGGALLQKELDHYNKGLVQDLSRTQCMHVAEHFRRDQFDGVLAMIGEGVIRARDVVFYLFPEHRRPFLPTKSRYFFRLHVTGTQQREHEILSQLQGVIRLSDVTVDRTNVSFNPRTKYLDLQLSGSCDDRLQFADFVELLERQEWVSRVQTLISKWQKLSLIGAFALAFAVIFLDILLFPAYEQMLERLPLVPQFLIQALPLIPILAASYYVLRLLRHYVARMRSDRWFLGIGLLLNIIGLMLLVLRILLLKKSTASLLPLIAIFSLSMIYVGYTFFQTDALLAPFDERRLQPMNDRQWRSLKRRKVAGYVIRLIAVLIWGLEPVYIRYTDVNDLSPFLRTFLLGIGVVIPSVLIYITRSAFKKRSWPKFTLPYDWSFLILVIGQVGYMYFKNASLVYTTGTNLLLFNNFSPLLSLVIAAFFWRRDIPYFKQPRVMFWIFLLAVTAGIGSALLVHNNLQLSHSSSILGDALAMISTFFDILMTIGQIQYIKRFPKTDGTLLNLHIFLFLLMCTAPVVLFAPLVHMSLFDHLTVRTLLLGLGIGLFVGFGQLLNYEAFKRIDGYLAYMLFNLSILVTFVMEAFVVHSVQPTSLLIVSGILIIAASVLAEYLNSRCQRKGL